MIVDFRETSLFSSADNTFLICIYFLLYRSVCNLILDAIEAVQIKLCYYI
jgi:hypothetical protein